MNDIHQTIKAGAKSICQNCVHYPVCRAVDNQPCDECNQYAPPVRHGRWIEDHDYLKCPECSVMVKWDFTFFDIGDWNYCPNCGAKMDLEDENHVGR